MRQRVRGVDQMREGKPMLQAFQQILEQGVQLDIASKGDNRLLIRDAQALQIMRHVGADGMKPMNGPRRISVCSIRVRCAGVNYQQLISANLMPMASHLAPPLAFGAIDENHLGTTVLARALMSGGFWIVTGVGRQKISQ